jgi:serine/threonine protein kinase
LRRFEQEARAAAALNHPNILAIFQMGTYEGAPYLVSELLDGEILREQLLRGPMPARKAIDYSVQIARGLAAAHEKGVVHRDLKPENLFITNDGRAKILDFGLAKLTERHWALDGNLTTVTEGTEPGVVMGTVGYMSPEQVSGKPADHRSDIFALGAIMYEALAGKRAFQKPTTAETMSAILNEDPPTTSQFVHTIPPLQKVVHRCLEKNPAQRFQSASDLAFALEALSDSGVQSATASAEPEQPLRKKRKWGHAAVSAVIVLAAVLAILQLRPRSSLVSTTDWVQITNLPDSVSQPALSPDGRMLAFLRGPNTFAGQSELYVKLLPDGEMTQLTRDTTIKMSPAFSPDGSRIAYSVLGPRATWDTWTVPVLSGTPHLWFPNASGLVWIDKQRLLFSEIKKGQHMGIVTSLETRAESRDIYLPGQEVAMAHRSFVSPNGKWVLIAEHDEKNYWRPCRVAPFEGSSITRQVGPAGAPCMSAAWSPDGKWMYLSVRTGSNFHLWRQRFPDGKPEQLTAGPTEEEGIAVAPDGASLITAVGLRERPIWIHSVVGDRQVSRERYAFRPLFYATARKVLYRASNGYQGMTTPSEIWAADLDSGHTEAVLPGVQVIDYDLSSDGRLLVCALDSGGKPHLWVAPLDHRSPPRQIGSAQAMQALFGPPGVIFFVASEGTGKYLFEIREDGSGLRKVSKEQMIELQAVSPDGQWVSGWHSAPGGGAGTLTAAYPTDGGVPIPICGPPCTLKWAPDGKYVYVSKPHGFTSAGAVGRTYVLPTRRATMFPDLPAGGFRSEVEMAAAPGVRVIEAADVDPSAAPDVYVFSRETTQRNLYRIPLR